MESQNALIATNMVILEKIAKNPRKRSLERVEERLEPQEEEPGTSEPLTREPRISNALIAESRATMPATAESPRRTKGNKGQ